MTNTELVADEVGRKLEDFNFHQTSTFSKDDLKDVMRQLLQEYGVARATPAPGTAAVVDLTKYLFPTGIPPYRFAFTRYNS